MKHLALSLVAVAILAGCSSSGKQTGPISEQKLATSFVGENIKIETSCSWFSFSKTNCEIVSLEVVGTDSSFGGTATNRKSALTRAELRAKAQVARFLNEQITTTQVKNVIAKNLEKAQDRVRSGSDNGQTVAMTDQEANKVSLRENNNDTVVELTENVRSNAQTILRGFRKTREDITGVQEVSVTIRWDRDSEQAADYFRSRFGR